MNNATEECYALLEEFVGFLKDGRDGERERKEEEGFKVEKDESFFSMEENEKRLMENCFLRSNQDIDSSLCFFDV